jgi:hypothetical protein
MSSENASENEMNEDEMNENEMIAIAIVRQIILQH